jgi:hypothetical protein
MAPSHISLTSSAQKLSPKEHVRYVPLFYDGDKPEAELFKLREVAVLQPLSAFSSYALAIEMNGRTMRGILARLPLKLIRCWNVARAVRVELGITNV